MCDAPVPVDVPLAFGSAVVCYAIASAFCCFGRCFTLALGFGFGCSCGLLLAQPPLYAVLFAVPVPPPTHQYTSHTLHLLPAMPDITPPTPRFTHTPHPHHTTSTHHTQSSPPISLPQTRSCPRKSEMAYSLFCALDARCALIKSNKFS